LSCVAARKARALSMALSTGSFSFGGSAAATRNEAAKRTASDSEMVRMTASWRTSSFAPRKNVLSRSERRRPLLLVRVGDLLEVELDHPGVVVAVLGLHVLHDLRPQLAGQLAPRLAGVLLGIRPQHTRIGLAAAGGAEIAGTGHLIRRLAGLLGRHLPGRVLQRLRRLPHRGLSALRLGVVQLALGLSQLLLRSLHHLARLPVLRRLVAGLPARLGRLLCGTVQRLRRALLRLLRGDLIALPLLLARLLHRLLRLLRRIGRLLGRVRRLWRAVHLLAELAQILRQLVRLLLQLLLPRRLLGALGILVIGQGI